MRNRAVALVAQERGVAVEDRHFLAFPLSSRVQRAPHAPAVGPPGAHRAPAPAANPPHPAPGVGGTARAPCTPPCAHRLGLFICGPHPLHPRGPSCPPPAPRGAPGRR